MPEGKKVVAVFGSLRKDGSEHQKLAVKKPTFLSQKRITGYKLYDMAGAAEVMAGTPEDSVLVDIFRVGPQGQEILANVYPVSQHEDVVLSGEGLDGVVIPVYTGELSEHAAIITSGDWNGYAATRPQEVGAEGAEEEEEEAEEMGVEDIDCATVREELDCDDEDVARITSVVDHDILDGYTQAFLQELTEQYDVTIKAKGE